MTAAGGRDIGELSFQNTQKASSLLRCKGTAGTQPPVHPSAIPALHTDMNRIPWLFSDFLPDIFAYADDIAD